MKNVTGNVMNLNHFVDFYYLEALRANISMAKNANKNFQFRRAVEKLETDVNDAFDALTQTMALRIYVYLWGAALGEVMYAHEYCDEGLAEVTDDWSYRQAFDYFPSEHNVQMVKNAFGQYWQSSGYGGRKWKQIVEGMELYGKISDAAFIDHAVDLEHNGGCVFDKTNEQPFLLNCFAGIAQSTLKAFLDIKFSNDILNNVQGWQFAVSRKVYSLVVRYSNVIEEISAVDFLNPSLEWLTPFTVEWNDFDSEFTMTDAESGRQCNNCGCSISEWEFVWVNDEEYCNECTTTCEHCDETVLSSDTTYIDGENETWCDDCAHTHSVTCEECNKDYNTDNTVYTEDEYTVCEGCAVQCEHCKEFHYNMEEHVESEHEAEEEEELHPLPFDSGRRDYSHENLH